MNSTVVYQPNFLEQTWLQLFDGSEYPSIRVAVVLFIWHEIVFFGRYLPFWIADQIPFFQQYRIQPDKIVTSKEWWYCTTHVIWWQFVIQLPMMMTFHPIAMYLGMKFLEVPFPSLWTIFYQNMWFIFNEDWWQYWMHRAMHWGPFYKHIHKMHHKYSAPFGIASEYAHPIETLVLGLGFFIGPLSWVLFTGDLHIISVFVWLGVRLTQVVEAHSGYLFPWEIYNFNNIWGGPEFHDFHHRAFTGNYGSFFRLWDRLMGTDKAFQEYKARLASKQKIDEYSDPADKLE
ncbi:hypothetical protein EDD86DRAFT_202536 [Gorgonomyces haynaldii]|nr:hypothetical protein EDD86DRAFT_202536 [Gorgonomyces haynaldii]